MQAASQLLKVTLLKSPLHWCYCTACRCISSRFERLPLIMQRAKRRRWRIPANRVAVAVHLTDKCIMLDGPFTPSLLLLPFPILLIAKLYCPTAPSHLPGY